MRLAKYLASAGIASRRAAEELIRAGRVTVGGEPVTDPAFGVGDCDVITFDGQPVAATESVTRVVYAVNKPLGVVSTSSDPQGRPTIVSLVRTAARLYPVGRLDADTTGLILLTNDGDLAHRLTHPRFEVEKTYRARLGGGPVRDTALRRLRAGVQLDDGMTSPARVRRVGAGALELTIREGRKRQVRRMCEAVGYRVVALERVRFGPLELGSLASGASRRLTAAEIALLQAAGRG
jgi:23S rRNA pseudouridine2605 synthase